MKKIKTLLCASTSLFIASCGQESTPSAAYNALTDNKPSKALAMAHEQLAAKPESAVFNSIAIAATLQKCLAEACFAAADNNTKTLPPLLQNVLPAAKYAALPVKIDDDLTLNLTNITQALSAEIMALPNQPEPLLAALKVTPEYARAPFIDALSQAIQTALLNNDIATATKLLHPMTREDIFPKSVRHLAAYAFGMLSKKETFAQANLVALKAHKAVDVAPTLWGILPLVWYQLDTTQSSGHWLDLYDEQMPDLIPLMQPASWQETARILGILTTQDTTHNVAITTRQLALWPDDEPTWRNYIPAIRAYLQDTGNTNLLTLIDPLNIPAAVRNNYNGMLFSLIAPFNAAGRDGLPLLQQVALQEMPKPSQVRLEKLTKAGLDQAVSKQDIPLVLRYATFRPSVAESTRRTIVPAVVDEIKAEFKANNFDRVIAYGDFLKDKLGVDFDLDAIILETYNAILISDKVAAALSADSPDWILRDEPYNLGAKFAFLQTRFAEKPSVTDDILKNLVSNATGIYGTPTAFYRLMHLFNDTTFPKSEREQYLRASVQSSLENDRELSAVAISGLGYKLHEKHQLSLNFIAIESLDRTDNLADERALWKTAPDIMKQTWQTSRPSFATLMGAVDQFDAGDKASAAILFNNINNTYYLEQAEPYFEHYAKTVNQAHGWYIPLDINQSPLGLIGIFPRKETYSGGLTDLNITLMNRLGSQTARDVNTYTTNHAAIQSAQIPSTLNFDNNTLPLETTDIEQLTLPEPFEETFGALTKFKLALGKSGAPLLKAYRADTAATQTFLRVTTDTALPLAPQGAFTITAENNKHDGITGILPKGTKITLATDLTDPIQLMNNNTPVAGRIFPVAGKLNHPAGTQPLAIKGFYTPETHLIDLQFNYPLTGDDGRTAKAVARCQLLGRILVCGSHPSHINRNQYSVISTGKLSSTDWQKWQVQQKKWADKIEASRAKAAAAKATTEASSTIITE